MGDSKTNNKAAGRLKNKTAEVEEMGVLVAAGKAAALSLAVGKVLAAEG